MTRDEAIEKAFEARSNGAILASQSAKHYEVMQQAYAAFHSSLAASGYAVVPVEATATHKKRGSTYDVLGIAVLQSNQPLYDMDRVVVYRSHEDGALWVRRYLEMYDGRFEIVEQEDSRE